MNWDRWIGNFDNTPVFGIKHLLKIPFPTLRERYKPDLTLWNELGCFVELDFKEHLRADLHEFVAADAPGCYHSHIANAVRIVLAGGYVEEVLETGECCVGGTPVSEFCCGFPRRRQRRFKQRIEPGHIGLIRPGFIHRVDSLLAGPSLSLWLRGRVTHAVRLYGEEYERRFVNNPAYIQLTDGGLVKKEDLLCYR